MDQKNIWAALKAVVTNIFKKKQIHGNSSEESCNLKVPLVKLKKQKTSKRTYRKKTVPNIPSYKDDRRAESENSDDTNLRNVSVIKLQKKRQMPEFIFCQKAQHIVQRDLAILRARLHW